jgi:hypothetical protein
MGRLAGRQDQRAGHQAGGEELQTGCVCGRVPERVNEMLRRVENIDA